MDLLAEIQQMQGKQSPPFHYKTYIRKFHGHVIMLLQNAGLLGFMTFQYRILVIRPDCASKMSFLFTIIHYHVIYCLHGNIIGFLKMVILDDNSVKC